MSSQRDKQENPEQENEVTSLNEGPEKQPQSARRSLLKATWIAPVVFAVAAQQAFAGSPMERRR